MPKILEEDKTILDRIGEIDRSEEVKERYFYAAGKLYVEESNISIPNWNDQPEKLTDLKAIWSQQLDFGGTLFAAYEDDALVGFAVYNPRLEDGLAQLVALHVSRPYRHRTIGLQLAKRVIELAKKDKASAIYVSSTPSKTAVDFYLFLGFVPVDIPNAKLHAESPNNIHMSLRL